MFSLPSNEQDDIDSIDDINDSTKTKISPLSMKPSTYGEITPLGARQLFGAMGLLETDNFSSPSPKNNKSNNHHPSAFHFFDLGSGTGKLVDQAVLEASIERATGVELSPSRHESAIQAKYALIERLQRQGTTNNNQPISSERYTNVINKLELIESDLFDVDLSTATHIYVASLCFPDNLMLRLEERLRQRVTQQREQEHDGSDNNDKDDTVVTKLQWVATLRQFPNDLGGIKPIIRFMEMSWTSPLGCAVYLYQCDS